MKPCHLDSEVTLTFVMHFRIHSGQLHAGSAQLVLHLALAAAYQLSNGLLLCLELFTRLGNRILDHLGAPHFVWVTVCATHKYLELGFGHTKLQGRRLVLLCHGLEVGPHLCRDPPLRIELFTLFDHVLQSGKKLGLHNVMTLLQGLQLLVNLCHINPQLL